MRHENNSRSSHGGASEFLKITCKNITYNFIPAHDWHVAFLQIVIYPTAVVMFGLWFNAGNTEIYFELATVVFPPW